MKAVFLDYSTLGAGELDASPLFEALPDLEIYDNTPEAKIVERIRDAEFVLTNKCRLDAATMSEAKALRYIGLAATGTDNVDRDYAGQNGIAVTNIRAYCTQSVVEHVFGVLFTLTHSLHRYRADVRAGAWQSADNFCLLTHPLRELSAMTLGIVGYGELGGAVARTARSFGMQVLVSERPGRTESRGDGRVGFETLLRIADVVSLHCPLTEATKSIMSTDAFRLMQNDSLLINTARGGLVDSAALVTALEAGEIGGAAIDVLAEEPPAHGDPLLAYTGDNLILTPHIAWATAEARQNAIIELALNIAAFQQGKHRGRVD